MRYSRKRKLHEDSKAVHVIVSDEAKEKLDRMAGQDSLGWMVEELIIREWRRREKRLTLHVPESAINREHLV